MRVVGRTWREDGVGFHGKGSNDGRDSLGGLLEHADRIVLGDNVPDIRLWSLLYLANVPCSLAYPGSSNATYVRGLDLRGSRPRPG